MKPPRQGSVTFLDYIDYLGIRASTFFGVQEPGVEIIPICGWWTLADRTYLANALAQSEDRIQRLLGYKLSPTFEHQRHMTVTTRPILDWGYILGCGKKVETDTLCVVNFPWDGVSWTDDEAWITIDKPTDYASSTFEIFYDQSVYPRINAQIPYSDLVAGDPTDDKITIYIPRWCLIIPEEQELDPPRPDVVATYAPDVTVRQIHSDCSVCGIIIYEDPCTFVRSTDTFIIWIVDARNSIIKPMLARYDSVSLTWIPVQCACPQIGTSLELYYRAGLEEIPIALEEAVIRLAHTLMPTTPCSTECEPAARFWRRDTTVPNPITRERINCDFGFSDGAWYAWTTVGSYAIGKGGSAFGS